MHTAQHRYYHNGKAMEGYVAFDDTQSKPYPAVLVMHDWSGRNAFVCNKAEMLAKQGYLGFAVDLYGEARVGNTTEEKMSLMQPLMQDRVLLRDNLLAALNTVRQFPEVDKNQIAAIGFCFGGLCVLDLARSGADIKGVVSFHGLLSKPEALENNAMKSKILVLHGYDDPMVKPDQVNAFCHEMTSAKVDWQVHMYGNTQHAFANPEAHDQAMGTVYNACAEQRALQAMDNFLQAIFTRAEE